MMVVLATRIPMQLTTRGRGVKILLSSVRRIYLHRGDFHLALEASDS